MTKAIKKISESGKTGPTAFKLLLSVFFLLLVFHGFFIAATIANAVDSEKKLKNISYREYRNTELEKEYINLMEKLDMDYARTNGFVEKNGKIVYITRYNYITQR